MIKSTLCYIKKDGCLLMLLRNKKEHDLNEGKWVGVGGKLEEGENPEDCLLREVKEETGLSLTSWTFHGVIGFHSDKWPDEEMYLYSADAFYGTLTECDEGTLRFIPEDEVLSLPLWEGDRLFLQEMLAGKTGISMNLWYEGNTLVKAE